MSEELKIAIEAAKIGAKKALSYFNSDLSIDYKEDLTPVTIADKETEKEIKNFIKSKISNAKFVGEEEGGNINQDEFWIIDPIDGTRSFIRGIPTWNVLIAFCKNKEIICGVCYFPILNELLYAEKSKGGYLNGKKITVSKINNIKKAYVSYGSPRHFKDKKMLLNIFEKVGSARSPDAAYSSFLLCIGKYDAHIDGYGQIWDAAPFKIILEEAGGKFTNLKGEKWKITDRGYIATNGLLHNEVIAILNNKQ